MKGDIEILKNAFYGRYGATQIDEEEIRSVTEVLEKKELFRYDIDNSKTDQLEKGLREACGAAYALAVCNGSAAIKAALVALQITSGDEILVTPYTFIATVNSIISIGAVPTFVDIDETLSFDFEDAQRKITDRTKAILVVHIQGDGVEIRRTREFADKNNLMMIEDCAQAFGSLVNGDRVGVLADIGCFSLQANKLITCGEGGFLICNNKEYYVRARNFHDQGGNREENSFANWDNPLALFGENLKITEIQSALGIVQLRKSGDFIRKLRKNRAFIVNHVDYDSKPFRAKKCSDSANSNGVSIPFIAVSKTERDRIVKHLKENNIPAITLYDKLIYEFELYKNGTGFWKSASADCKSAENLKGKMFWILNSIDYGKDELEHIIDVTNQL